MAEGIYKAAEMVFGSLSGIHYACLWEDKGIEEFEKELRGILKRLDETEPAAVLCDVNGGSPYNTSLRLLEEMGRLEKVSVVSGMNLPLLLVLMMAEDVSRETVKASIAAAQDGLQLFGLTQKEDDEEL